MNRLRKSLKVLEQGLNDSLATVDDKEGERLIQAAKRVGMMLVLETQIAECGYWLKRNTTPVLRKYFPAPIQQHVDLYDLQSQCVEVP